MPTAVQTMILMFFADLEIELGATMDWCSARAAEEQKPLGTYLAQVVKLYQDDLIAQEARVRELATRRRRFDRIRATMADPNGAGNPVRDPHQ